MERLHICTATFAVVSNRWSFRLKKNVQQRLRVFSRGAVHLSLHVELVTEVYLEHSLN